MTVKSMSEYANDGRLRSPEDCLKECLKYIGERGAFKSGKKLLVICVDDTENNYSVSWAQAGMKMSQCISACEVAKTLFLSEMGYVTIPEDASCE